MPEGLWTPRAERYVTESPLRVRPRGEHEWHKGTLHNISASGLLLTTETSIPDEAEMDIVVSLGPDFANIWCRTIVVRRDSGSAAIGARITAYRLRRPRRAFARHR